MFVAYTCNFTDSLPSSHGPRRTGRLSAAGKVDSLGPVQSNQFLRRGGGGGCESCQHSFHNNDITRLTSAFSCAPAGQRYMSMDVDRRKTMPTLSFWVAACYAWQMKAERNDYKFQQKAPPREGNVNALIFSLVGSLLSLKSGHSLPKPLLKKGTQWSFHHKQTRFCLHG